MNKKLTEEKERLFSYSSYKKYELYKKQQEENLNNKKSNLLLHKETKQMVPTKKFQKNKKRKSTSDLLDSNSYSNSTIMNSNGSGRDSASIVSDLDGRRSVDFTDASSRK